MTTTFDLSSGILATHQRSQLRLLIGDTAENDGPRPGQRNFQDEELDVIALLEGGDLNRAAARAFEVLAGEWARYSGTYRLGPETEESRQAAAYGTRAKELREMYGYTLVPDGAGDVSGVIIDWSPVYDNWVGRF